MCAEGQVSPSFRYLKLSIYASIHLENLHTSYFEGEDLYCVP